VTTKLGQGYGLPNSPDDGNYPFMLLFSMKNSANQQENGLLKIREPFASKK
jgi:hypothetical protein